MVQDPIVCRGWEREQERVDEGKIVSQVVNGGGIGFRINGR